MKLKENEKVPSAEVFLLEDGEPIKKDIQELLKDKRVVLFGLPGAYTSVCSAKHLPGYVNTFDKYKSKGVDHIICMSANDPFVMDAWMKSYSNSKINYVADSNSELLNSSGLEMDLSVIGLGKRLSRFAMFIDNGLIKMIFDEKGGGLEKSKAENVLENL